MNPESYSPEQQTDILERVEKAKKALEELQLRPSSQVSVVNVGNDVFASKVVSYLQDTRYTPQASPIQAKDL